ncbi:MAG: T9SS type A sorting domain-containing protein [Bacteroidota bacterium]
MRKRNLHILLLYFISSSLSNAQPLSIQWQKCFGGTLDEEFKAIRKTEEGGFIIDGGAISNDGNVSGNHGMGDYWIVRTDSFGNLIWQKCFGGSNGDIPFGITIDNNKFIAVGITGSNDGDITDLHNNTHGDGDFWFVKGDSVGNKIWAKCYGGTNTEEPSEIITCHDHGKLIIGYTRSNDDDVSGLHDTTTGLYESDAWIVKIDTGGSILWSKCYGGLWPEVGRSIVETPDSGFIFVADERSVDGDATCDHAMSLADYWVVKIDSIGSIQWSNCFGGYDDEIPRNIICTKDGGYAVIGTSASNDFDVTDHHGAVGDLDAWVIKIDSVGNLQWTKSLGGSNNDIGFKIIQLPDSGFLTLCYTNSTDGDLASTPANWTDVWLVKLDPSGNIEWGQTFGGSRDDAAYDIQLTPDGGVIFAGLTLSNDGDVSGNHGGFDGWLVKLNPLPNRINNSLYSFDEFSCTTIPATNSISLTCYANKLTSGSVNLYDIGGRLLFHQRMSFKQGPNKKEISGIDISCGIYLVRLETEDSVITKKVAVLN